MLLDWEKNYKKVSQAKGLLKHKKEAMLAHLDAVRQEWDG
ncbi:hypothetical protein COO91_07857 [Nostoc flagelliforme CCNUN1]|nr:hypothetical protein COO91_07857 [Nostoc flagelliforme CCNUN1]